MVLFFDKIMLTIKRILGTEITSIKRNRKARRCLIFGGDFNKSSFLFWLLEFTAVGFFTVGIEPFAAEKICKKNCTENLHLCISRASYASLVTQSIQSLVGILIVLVLPFEKWKLKCFSWQLVLSQTLSVKMSWVPREKSDFSFCADI